MSSPAVTPATEDDEVSTRKILLYQKDMTVKVVDRKNNGDKLDLLQNTSKLRVDKKEDGSTLVEAYDGSDWKPVDDSALLTFITEDQGCIEIADLPSDTKADYNLTSLIVVM